jgi:iron complex outermembrane recepter protein
MSTMIDVGIAEALHREPGARSRRLRPGHQLLLLSVLLPLSAFALAEPLPFDIPAQPLATALKTFADQAKMQLLYKPDAISAGTSNALMGDFEKRTALELLLKDTGLEVVFSEGNAATIRPMQSASKITRISTSATAASAQEHADTAATAGRLRLAQAEARASGPDQDLGQLEEITVTATRRSESIVEVPLSISAYDEETLRRTGAVDFQAIADRVPGLTFTSNGVGANRYFIRGIGQVATNQSPTTGLYFDETPLQVRMTTGYFQPEPILYDLNRVEVLRGPQGTLFGSSAMGGSVRFISNKPDTTRFEGSMSAGLSSVKDGGRGYDVKGMVNLPIASDKFAVRLVAVHNREAGWVDDLRPLTSNIYENIGQPVATRKDTNWIETNGARIMATFTPDESLRITPTFYIQKRESGAVRPESDEVFGKDARLKARWIDEPSTARLWTGNLLVEKDVDLLGGMTLMSSTSRLEATFDRVSDVSAFGNPQFSTNRTQVGLFSSQEANQWAQDFRVVSQSDAALQYVAGLYYLDTKTPTVVVNRVVNDFGGGLNPEQRFRDFRFSQQEQAAYGELTYEIGDFKISAGGRYFRYDQSDNRLQRRPAGVDYNFTVETDESGFTPHVGLSYMPTENQNYYINYAEGYRTGGVNVPITQDACPANVRQALGIPDVPPPFKSDTTKNKEIGAKLLALNGRLSFSTALYSIDWDEYQQAISRDCGGASSFSYTANAGKVRSRGFEAELAMRPLAGLRLTGGIALVDAKFEQPNEQLGIVAGDALWDVPKWTYNASAEYEFDITPDLAGRVKADGNYVASSRSGLAEDVPPPKRDEYTIINVDAALVTELWDVTLYVKNLTDEVPNYGLNFAFGDMSPIPYSRITGLPRTVGVTLARKFR